MNTKNELFGYLDAYFTPEDLIIIMEIANRGLDQPWDDIADHLDLSDKELSKLQAKIMNFLEP